MVRVDETLGRRNASAAEVARGVAIHTTLDEGGDKAPAETSKA